MNREPIYVWMLREKDISSETWDAMVGRAANQLLREDHPLQSTDPIPVYEDLGSIEKSELGGGVERILARAFGWESYESRPTNLPELALEDYLGD